MSLKLAGPMATKAIVVTNNFNDPDAKAGDSLDLSAKSSDETIVTVATSGMTVTVTAVALGRSRHVTVTVTDKDSLTAKDTFKVTVAASIAPEIIEKLPDMWLGTDRMSETIDLADHFFHSSEITYSVRSADDLVATATIEGSVLTVTSKDTSDIRMVVTATADGLPTQDGFQVYVRDHPVAGPYDMGEIDDIELTVGASQEVDVVDNFADPNDQDLTLIASSEDEDIATVEVDGSIVTVTAVADGMASIKVYVHDEDGLRSDDLWFEVTVTPALVTDPDSTDSDPTDSDSTDPEPIDSASGLPVDIPIKGVGEFWEWTLTNAGHRVISEDTQVVKVLRTTGMMVKLEGVKRGDTRVYVVDAENEVVGAPSDVTVKNSPPMRNTDVDPNPIYTMLAIDDGDTMDVDESTTVYVVVNDGAIEVVTSDGVRNTPDLVSFFKDADLGDGDKLEFKASTDSNYVKASVNAGQLEVDVVKKDGASFIVTITAKDDTGKTADAPVMLAVRAMVALPKTYELNQEPRGVLGTITVDNRQDVPHTIVVGDPADTEVDRGFVFASLSADEYTDVGTAVFVNEEDPPAEEHGVNYYILESAGAITDVAWDPAVNMNPPDIKFTLTGTARNTSITVKYFLFIVPTGEDADKGDWKKAAEKLTLDIR